MNLIEISGLFKVNSGNENPICGKAVHNTITTKKHGFDFLFLVELDSGLDRGDGQKFRNQNKKISLFPFDYLGQVLSNMTGTYGRFWRYRC